MNYDVLVVGGGAAGLTAAAYAARAGKTVALFEQQAKLGGLVQSVNHDGFVFDMGLRAIENSGMVLPMVSELGLPLEYVRSRVSVGIADRIISIESKDSIAEYGDLLRSFYPGSADDIEAILDVIRRTMRDMDVLYGIDNPLFKDLSKDYRYIFRTLLPWAVKFLFTIGRINRTNTPVERFLAELTTDESLRSIIGQHFFRSTPAFFAMSYFSIYLDYLYPKGGTGSLMRLLADFCAAHGVDIHTQLAVLKVNPAEKTITAEDGSVCTYGALIWAADLNRLFAAVDESVLPDAKTRRSVALRREELRRAPTGDSVFSVFLSVDESPEYFRNKSEGHFFYTPDPRGLRDLHTKGLDELLANYDRSGDRVEVVTQYLRQLLLLNTFEISIPAVKDPTMAPPGKTGLIVSWLFDHALATKVHEDGWFERLKDLCMDEVIRILSSTVYPGLEGKILDRFVSTPLTIEKFTGNSGGAITGWAFGAETMPVVNQMQRVAKSVLTPMKDIYQAGQWTYSPSGLPIAILTGKLAANRAVKG
jgi:phytoene dehydrogenase-like protein